jgi:hypothetical protein
LSDPVLDKETFSVVLEEGKQCYRETYEALDRKLPPLEQDSLNINFEIRDYVASNKWPSSRLQEELFKKLQKLLVLIRCEDFR